MTESSTEAVFVRYIEAINAHDLETLASLTADDAEWGKRVGKAQVLLPQEFDAAINIQVEAHDMSIQGDVVEFTLIERNDHTRAHGPESLTFYPRFVFRSGQLIRKETWKASPNMKEFSARALPFWFWLRRNRPEARAKLAHGPGRPILSYEAGVLRSRMLREWVAAGRPGS